VKRAPVREATEVTLDQFDLAKDDDIKNTCSLLGAVVVEPLRKKSRVKKHGHNHRNSQSSEEKKQDGNGDGNGERRSKEGDASIDSGGLLGDTYDSDD